MRKKHAFRLLALLAAAALLLSSCALAGAGNNAGSTALTWDRWDGYGQFWELLAETEPDIDVEPVCYTGANHTAYSWAQLRADDICDLFSTTQILDGDLAKERLVDLSAYDFVDGLSTPVLDQVSIDGGIYLLPVSNNFYGILYNKTLLEEKGWALPSNFRELETLCRKIRAEGMTPGILATQVPGSPFCAVFNLAKTDWLATPEGINWERSFLSGTAAAAGRWEGTMGYVKKYIDAGMFTTDPRDRSNKELIEDYLAGRKAVFFTMASTVDSAALSNGDELGMMPYLSEDGSKNIYMYNPSTYIGISKRLTEPGNEEKLEKAIRLLARLFSPEGQAAFVTEQTPCMLSALENAAVPAEALACGAQQAMRQGLAFPMTYANWEDILTDIGQAYKNWFRGKEGSGGAACIARMDALQSDCLTHQEEIYFCESTADFTVEETARLAAKALGSAAETDAAMIPYAGGVRIGDPLRCGITGKLYQGRINSDISASLAPALNGQYAVLTMTGAQAKELAQAGFLSANGGAPFPYVLETRGGAELNDNKTYTVAFLMRSYPEETGEACSAQLCDGSFRVFLRKWLAQQETVSPDGNPWE